MAVWKVEANYLEQVLPEYRDNPLIEALPDIMSDDDTIAALTATPAYSEDERKLDAKYRMHCISRLLHDYYQPLPQHLDIEKRIDEGQLEAIDELKNQIRLYGNLLERAEYILERTTKYR